MIDSWMQTQIVAGQMNIADTIRIAELQNDISTRYTNIYYDILERLAALERTTPDFTELKCRECGATIEQKYENHIVKCPYCKTVYAIGRKLVNA